MNDHLQKSSQQMDFFIQDIQEKSSSLGTKGAEDLIRSNRRFNHFWAVREGLREFSLLVLKLPLTTEKQALSGWKEQAETNLKEMMQSLQELRGTEKIADVIHLKLASLKEKTLADEGLASLQLKALSVGGDKIKEKVYAEVKNIVTEIEGLRESLEKEFQEAQQALKMNTGDAVRHIHSYKNTNQILLLASELSRMNASIMTQIIQSVRAQDIQTFEQEVSKVDKLFKATQQIGQGLKDLLVKEGFGGAMQTIFLFFNSLTSVSDSFSGKGGVVEKVRASIKSSEELERLNREMRKISARQMEMSSQEVSKAEMIQEEVVGSLNHTARKMVFMISIVGGLIALMTLLMGIFISRSITRPIQHAVVSITEASDQLTSASSQVSSASQSLAGGASEQAAGIEQTSSSIEEMASMTKRNAENAREANLLSEKGIEMMKTARGSMKAMVESIEKISKSSEETGKIVKAIDEIAFQTNLLALNAAVEAARAGEAGAGFAVVADEVRHLALKAAEAAKSTSILIDDTIQRVREGAALVHQTDASYKEVALTLKKMVDLIGEIASASQEQAQGVEQISKALNEMDKVVQKNAANAEESASAAEEMNAQAEQMRGVVEELVALVNRRKDPGGNGLGSAFLVEKGEVSLDQMMTEDMEIKSPDGRGHQKGFMGRIVFEKKDGRGEPQPSRPRAS